MSRLMRLSVGLLVFAATVLSIPHVLKKDSENLQRPQRSGNNVKGVLDSDQVTSFEEFKTKFAKTYSDDIDSKMRREIFEENLDYISKHNAAYMNGDETFWLRMNHLGDLTRAEYRKMLGFRPSGPRGPLSAGNCTHEALAPNATVDWRSAGAVTNVKDQGQCGSCWAFSATGAIEGAWALARGQLVGVSEEEIVQCDTGNGDYGCNGGNMYKAFQYVIDNGGAASEAMYPYLSGNGTTGRCAALFPAFQAPVATVSAFCMVKAGDEADLERAVNQQPVSVGIEADQKAFQFYGGGILPAKRCGVNLDHGVLLVGYGYERDSNASLSMKYWTVKNSWGPAWGDDGYIRLEKFPASVDHSTCGIALDASYPIV